MQEQSFIDPKMLIAQELEYRCKKNSRYSLRAFAASLDMAPSALSMVLNGKRNLSFKKAQSIADCLSFSPQTKSSFLRGLATQKYGAKLNSATLSAGKTTCNQISLDAYELIAGWHHYAILSLIETQGFRPDVRWIASRLAISQSQVKAAVSRLVRLKILDTSSSRWRQTGGSIRVDNNVSTAATRKAHVQILEKAGVSLQEDPIEVRDFSAATMAIDPKLIPVAKAKIAAFRRELMAFLEEASSQKSEVYHLAMQIYPVSKPRRD